MRKKGVVELMSQVQVSSRVHRAGVPVVNIGLVGAGHIAKLHSAAYSLVPIYFDPPPAIPIKRVVSDIDAEHAQKGAERLGWEEWVESYCELVARNDVDIVNIATPNHLHVEVAVAAAEHGKMIVCEKPLGIDLESSRRAYEAAKTAGVHTAVTLQKRRYPAVMHAKNLFESGAIGEPVFYRGIYRQPYGLRIGPAGWRDLKASTGSWLSEVGVHVIDMARFLLGEFHSVNGMTNLEADQGKSDPEAMDVIEETIVFMAKLKSGALGSFEITRMASGESDGIGFEILGTRGAIRWDSNRSPVLEVSSEEVDPTDRGFKAIEMGTAHPFGNVWRVQSGRHGVVDAKTYEVHDILDAFVHDKPYSPDFYDGLRAAEVVDAVFRSVESQQWVEVPAK